MYIPISIISIVVIIFLIFAGNASNKIEEKGFFLKSEVRPYYDEILKITAPYANSNFVKWLLRSAQATLKNVQKQYDATKGTTDYNKNSIEAFLVESRFNHDIINLFSLIFIFSYKHDYSLTPPDSEINAMRSLKNFCRERLAKRVDDIPICFWENFYWISPKDLKREY